MEACENQCILCANPSCSNTLSLRSDVRIFCSKFHTLSSFNSSSDRIPNVREGLTKLEPITKREVFFGDTVQIVKTLVLTRVCHASICDKREEI